MELFYCEDCKKWFRVEKDGYYPEIRSATMVDPTEYSDELHCIKCDNNVDQYVVDDVLDLLNNTFAMYDIETIVKYGK